MKQALLKYAVAAASIALVALPTTAAADDELANPTSTVVVCSNAGTGPVAGNTGCLATVISYEVTCNSDASETVEYMETGTLSALPYVGNGYCASSPAGEIVSNTMCEAYGFPTAYESPCEDPCEAIEDELDAAEGTIGGLVNELYLVLDDAAYEACGSAALALYEAEYNALMGQLAAELNAVANLNDANWASCDEAVELIDKGTNYANDVAAEADSVFCAICEGFEIDANVLIDELLDIAEQTTELSEEAETYACGDPARDDLEADFDTLIDQAGEAMGDLERTQSAAGDEGCAAMPLPEELQSTIESPPEFPTCPPECSVAVPAAVSQVNNAVSQLPAVVAILESSCSAPNWDSMASAYTALSQQVTIGIDTLDSLSDDCPDAGPAVDDAFDASNEWVERGQTAIDKCS